ncbi:MAG: vitamin B12 dependent methionine synthase [Dehalococcoidia bacterium]|nr:vitamin B12 dependent methionine synthase [Dehalococcoidia bacterium]
MDNQAVSDHDLHVFSDVAFAPTADDVIRAMKIRKVSPSLSRLVTALVKESGEVANPKALCRVSYIDSRNDDAVVITGRTFTSRVLRQNLDGVERVFPFVATCGTELEGLLHDRSDIMAAYCLDTIMMLAVNAARRHVQEFIKRTFSLGQVSRMAPGSLQDWPLEQQGPLFDLLGDVEGLIGVRLTERYLMTPIKSVSGIFFPAEVRFESCQLCSRTNCPGRRAPYDPGACAKYGLESAGTA